METSIELQDSNLSPWFQLPVEVRLRIYRMVMVFDKTIVVAKAPEQVTVRKDLHRERNTARRRRRRGCLGYSALAIALSCRRIYTESIQQYYSLNTFDIRNAQICGDFVQAIGFGKAKMIRHIRFAYDIGLTCLYPFDSMETLEITRPGCCCTYALLSDMAAAQARTLCKMATRLKEITITPYNCSRSGDVCLFTGVMSKDSGLGEELNEYLRKRVEK